MMDGSHGSSSSISPVRPWPPRQRSAQDVDEEYGRAFKSRSFLDLWSHAHRSLKHNLSSYKLSSRLSSSFSDDQVPANEEPSSCSYAVLNDFVLEPSPETLTRPGHRRSRRCHGRRRVEALLLEYFDVTREACEACSALLAAAGAAQRHHLVLRRLLLRLAAEGDDRAAAARDALARHIGSDNPLSPAGRRLTGFNDAHARCAPLSRRLVATRRRLRRLARAARIARCAAATAIVGASAAAVVAAVVLAAHAVVGVGAAAVLTFCATSTTRPSARRSFSINKLARRCHRGRRRRHARAGEAAVDAAARGAYILGRDLDTVSRMVRRAHDELEHGRDMARIAVAAGADGGERPPLLLQEVAREEEECGEDLRCQLEELEEHACLCLLTINRSRRIVTQEMTTPDDGSPSTETTSKY
ncbi:putative UPF0496 protein 2 [Lolium perenne]|uniref:putative UPF0496 protein 2 n=1 Tax=Lolium perenne TaxID=4522 RepID=UPI0021F64A1C|nr:putative UPF0496 protein 2 [Lolium perenne]XP_051205409.1 LOW QUALITY PROTEIN: putative UPF0496 protein 2 [Lolium perenne]